MKRPLFTVLVLLGCGGGAPPMVADTTHTDSFGPASLTAFESHAEPNEQGLDPLAISTRVIPGKLAVEIEVGPRAECSFGQTDGPSPRTTPVSSNVVTLEVDASDAHAWLYGGASLECEGENPIYAWTALEPRVDAKPAEIDLEETADPMLSEKDAYVVRLHGSSFGKIEHAALVIGKTSYAGRTEPVFGEEKRWNVVFDVPPEVWIRSA